MPSSLPTPASMKPVQKTLIQVLKQGQEEARLKKHPSEIQEVKNRLIQLWNENAPVEELIQALGDYSPFTIHLNDRNFVQHLATDPDRAIRFFHALSQERALQWVPMLDKDDWWQFQNYPWEALKVLNEKTQGVWHDHLWGNGKQEAAILMMPSLQGIPWIRPSWIEDCRRYPNEATIPSSEWESSEHWWWQALSCTPEEWAIFERSMYAKREFKVPIYALYRQDFLEKLEGIDIESRHVQGMLEKAYERTPRPVAFEQPEHEQVSKALQNESGFCQTILGVNEAYLTASWQERWTADLILAQDRLWDSRQHEWRGITISEATRQCVRMCQWYRFAKGRSAKMEDLLFWLDQLGEDFRWPDVERRWENWINQNPSKVAYYYQQWFNPSLPLEKRLSHWLDLSHPCLAPASVSLFEMSEELWKRCLNHPMLQKTPLEIARGSDKDLWTFEEVCQDIKPEVLVAWRQEYLEDHLQAESRKVGIASKPRL